MSAVGTTAARAARVRAIRLRPRSTAALALASAVGAVAFAWPLLVGRGTQLSGVAHSGDAPFVFAALLVLLLGVLLAEIGEGGVDAKAVALLGVLAAIGAALRPLGAGTAGFETVFFLLVLGGRALGAGFGFVLGAVTLFASALITGGVGPWLPFQMLGAAWVGLGAGLLPPLRGRAEVVMLCGYGAVAALAFGLLLDLSFWPYSLGSQSRLSFVPGAPLATNLGHFAAFTAATSLGWDVGRALTNVLLVALTGRVVLTALRRGARRAAFDAAPEFSPTDQPASARDSVVRPSSS